MTETQLQKRHAASLAALQAVMAIYKARARDEFMGWPVMKGAQQ